MRKFKRNLSRYIEKIKKFILSRRRQLIPFSIVLTILLLSVGYSAFVSEINLSKTLAHVRIQKDIRVTGVSEVQEKTLSDVCTPVQTATTGNIPNGNYEPGDEYLCEVKPGTSYRFFVVSKDEENVNLIMYSNINDDGEPVDSNEVVNKGYTDWLSVTKYTELDGQITEEMLNESSCSAGGYCSNNSYGPISAMDYLQKATSTWTNLNPTIINKFMKNDGSFIDMKKTYTMYSRLPYRNEIMNAGNSTLYLIDYLNFSSSKPNEVLNNLNGPFGYWTATAEYSFNAAIAVTTYSGAAPESYYYYEFIGNNSDMGVRPVITLKKESSKKTVCTLTDKDGDGEADTGEVVSCNLSEGIENFYVVENDGTNVEMLTAYILNTSTYRQAEEIQSVDSWFPVTFSSTNYWPSTVTTYPADVYNDSNDVIKPIVDNYVTYLKSNLLNATGSLLKEDDLINLGCVASTVEGYEHQYDCSTEWVKSSNYWLATAVSSDTILTMEGGFVDSNGDYYSGLLYFGVRPVITISEDEISLASSGTTYTEYNVNSAMAGVRLPSENSSIILDVTVTNIGNAEAGIKEITGLPDNLTYELLDYNLKDKICDETGKCSLGISKDIKIRVKYKEGGYNSSNTFYDINLDFDFQQFYNVTYKDIAQKVCKLNDSNLNGVADIGEIITCELSESTDNFYVVENDGTNIHMLTENNIEPTTYRQSSTATTTAFATKVYWSYYDNSNDINYVYSSENDIIYPIVENYVSYLNENNITGATGKLISFEQLVNAGCSDTYSCLSAPTWVYSTSYWFGYTEGGSISSIDTGGSIYSGGWDMDYFRGIRPVITISVDEINKNIELPSEVMGGDTLTVDFKEFAPGAVEIKIEDKTVTDFIYSDGILTLPSVKNNVEITGVNSAKICKYKGTDESQKYSYGAEYECDPGDGISRTFYLLEDGDNTSLIDGTTGTTSADEVSLIMNNNIGEATVWGSFGDKTPTNALPYLKSQTTEAGWIVEVNMPTYEQIYAVNNSTDLTSTLWLTENLPSPESTSGLETYILHYWTSTYASSKIYILPVYVVSHTNYLLPNDGLSENIGVRPVITISKDKL